MRFQMLLAQAIILLIVFSFVFFLLSYYKDVYKSKLTNNNTNMVNQLSTNIQRNYIDLNKTMDSFATNTILQQFMSEDDIYLKTQYYKTLTNLMINYKKMNSEIKSIVLCTSDHDVYTDWRDINISVAEQLLSQTKANTLSDLIFARNDYYIAFKKPVYHNSSIRKKIGDVLFVMNASFVTSYLQDGLLDNDSDFYVINSEHKIIASNNKEYISMNIPKSYEKYIDKKYVIDSEYIAIAKSIPNTELSILCITPINVIFKDINFIEKVTIALTCICFALLLIVYFRFFERIYRSINQFLTHMKNVEAGDINAKIQIEDNLEFQRLSIGFNSMMSRINELNEKNLDYQKKVLLKEIENKHIQLLALQTQINPHFLYNTLECINSMGVLYNSWEIQEMATSLAFIFKYSVKGEHLVFVQDEIDVIEYYINIQQIRFPNKFNVVYEIDQNILSYKMLKFILQPIIENNFKHGIENSTDFYTIYIRGEAINNKLVISICDNGAGMDEERLREVQRDLNNSEETLSERYSIGLSNINKRLHLYYGSEYGINIESKKQVGTKVILTMPLVY